MSQSGETLTQLSVCPTDTFMNFETNLNLRANKEELKLLHLCQITQKVEKTDRIGVGASNFLQGGRK